MLAGLAATLAISTNTLLTEGDLRRCVTSVRLRRISTNTLLTEGDSSRVGVTSYSCTISTNTLLTEGDVLDVIKNFNQHPPHGG